MSLSSVVMIHDGVEAEERAWRESPALNRGHTGLSAGLASREKIIRLIDYDWKSTSVRRRMTTSD